MKDKSEPTTDEYEEGSAPSADDLRCGLFCWRPDCLQRCANVKALLTTLCLFAFVQGWAVNGINNVNTSTIERRFDMRSSQVAWISSSYDLTSAVLGLFMGYLALFISNGKLVTIGALVMALGSLVMVIPHMATGVYEYQSGLKDDCDLYGNSTSVDCGSGASLSNFIYVFILGQILHGVGGTACFTICPAYIDEHVESVKTPLFVGLFLAFAALGPAAAFIAGGFLLNTYVDVGRVDMDDIHISPSDPGWVGAWWIGFLISAVGSLIATILSVFFPPDLPGSAAIRENKHSEAYAGQGEEEMKKAQFGKSLSDVWLSIKVLLTNPTWIGLTLGATVESGAVMGFATFMPKVLQFQFSLTPGAAAVLAGVVVVPGAAGGHFLGGLLPKLLNLRIKGLMLFLILCSVLGIVFFPIFMLTCDMPEITGVNVHYFNSTASLEKAVLDHPCNLHCNCELDTYQPLCGTDGVQYFSPCHAACLESTETDTEKVYSDCSCISQGNLTGESTATEGFCSSSCTLQFVVFLILFLILMVSIFMASTIGTATTLRAVPYKHRAFAVGAQLLIVKALGNTPGPILLGVIFDSSCLVWSEKCGETGSCWVYENSSIAVKICITLLIVKAFSFVCFLCAYCFYKPPEEDFFGDKLSISAILNEAFSDKNSVECDVMHSENAEEVTHM